MGLVDLWRYAAFGSRHSKLLVESASKLLGDSKVDLKGAFQNAVTTTKLLPTLTVPPTLETRIRGEFACLEVAPSCPGGDYFGTGAYHG